MGQCVGKKSSGAVATKTPDAVRLPPCAGAKATAPCPAAATNAAAPDATAPSTVVANAPRAVSCADPVASLVNRLAQGSSHVWLLASWKNPHLPAAPLLPLDVPMAAAAQKAPEPLTAFASSSSSSAPSGAKTKAASAVIESTSPVAAGGRLQPGFSTSLTSPLTPSSGAGGVGDHPSTVHDLAPGCLFVRRPGELVGGNVSIASCHGAIFLLQTQLRKVHIEDCHNCFFFIGPTSTSLTLTHCVNCVVVTLVNQLVMEDCTGLLCAAHTARLPQLSRCGDIFMSAYSAWFTYNELPLHLRAAGLSPFINNYSTALDHAQSSKRLSSAASSVTGAVSRTAGPTSPRAASYTCVRSHVLDHLLGEWWLRVREAMVREGTHTAAVTVCNNSGKEEAAVDKAAAASGLSARGGGELVAYVRARAAWKAETTGSRSANAAAEDAPATTPRTGCADVAQVDVSGRSAPTALSTEAVRNLGSASSMLPLEHKLRDLLLSTPVVFLSAAVAHDATTHVSSDIAATASEAGSTTAMADNSLDTVPHNSVATVDVLYSRLRHLLCQHDPLVAAVKPSFSPRTLDDVRYLFEHAVVTPATLGAQHIPRECLQQRWRLKLFVVTAKGGGWSIAQRVVGDVERYRRTAVAGMVSGAVPRASGAAHGAARESGEGSEGPGANGGDGSVNDTESTANVVDAAVREMARQHGPVLLLNTAELRCSEVIMREFVAPTFFLLTEPPEVTAARRAQRGGGSGGEATELDVRKRLFHDEQHKGEEGEGEDSKKKKKRKGVLTDKPDVDVSAGAGEEGFFGRAKKTLQQHLGWHDDDGDELRDDQVAEKVGHPLPLSAQEMSRRPADGRTADSAARHLVAMRRLFGEAVQRMSGQTCVLLLALVTPTSPSGSTPLPSHPSSSTPPLTPTASFVPPSPTVRRPVALQQGVPGDPADVFQPLARAREQVLRMANAQFERRQSIVQSLLPPPPNPSIASVPSRFFRAEVSTGSAPLVSDDVFRSCVEESLSVTHSQPSLRRDDLEAREAAAAATGASESGKGTATASGSPLPLSTVPESRVQPRRLVGNSGSSSGGGVVASSLSSTPAVLSVPSPHPATPSPSAEELAWSRAVIVNVSLPLRLVTVLQSNLFFKACIASQQMASATSHSQFPPTRTQAD